MRNGKGEEIKENRGEEKDRKTKGDGGGGDERRGREEERRAADAGEVTAA